MTLRRLVVLVACVAGAFVPRATNALEPDPILVAWRAGQLESAHAAAVKYVRRVIDKREASVIRGAFNRLELVGGTTPDNWQTWRDAAGMPAELALYCDWRATASGDRLPKKDWGFCRSFQVTGPFDNLDGRWFPEFALTGEGPWDSLEGPVRRRQVTANAWGVLNLGGLHAATEQVLAEVSCGLNSSGGALELSVDSAGDWRLLVNGQDVHSETGPRRWSLGQRRLHLTLPKGRHRLTLIVADSDGDWRVRLRAEGPSFESWTRKVPAAAEDATVTVKVPMAVASLERRLDRRRRGLPDHAPVADDAMLDEQLLALMSDPGDLRRHAEIEDNERRQALDAANIRYPGVPRIAQLRAQFVRRHLKSPLALRQFRKGLENTHEGWLLTGETALETRYVNDWIRDWRWRPGTGRESFERQWALLTSAPLEKRQQAARRGLERWGDEALTVAVMGVLPLSDLKPLRESLKRHPARKWLRLALARRIAAAGELVGALALIDNGLALAPLDTDLVEVRVRWLELLERHDEARRYLSAQRNKRPGVAAWEDLARRVDGSEDKALDSFLQVASQIKSDTRVALQRVSEEVVVRDHGGGRWTHLERRLHRVHNPRALRGHHEILLADEGIERLTVLEASLRRKGTSLSAAIQSFVVNQGGDDDLRVTVVEWPPLEVGDELVLSYRHVRHRPSFFGGYFGLQHSFRDDWPLNRGQLDLYSDRELTVGGRGVKPVRAGEGHWTWSVAAVPGHPPEPLSPEPRALGPTIEASSFADWQEFVQWYLALTSRQGKLSEPIRRKVVELTKEGESLSDKAQALYRFVTDDIRYVTWEFGVHGYKPYSAAQIYENGFGDCKDKSLLLQTMLREIGVSSDLVVVRAEESRGPEDFSVPLVGHFNHCMLAVSLDGARLFVDGTAYGHGWVVPPTMDRDTRGVLISPRNGGLVELPHSTKARDELLVTDTLTLRSIGAVQWKAVARSTGRLAQPFRGYLMDEAHRTRLLSHFLARSWAPLKLKPTTLKGARRLDTPLTLRVEGIVLKAFDATTGRLALPDHFLQNPREWIRTHKVPAIRETPLLIEAPWNWSWTTTLTVPKGWTVKPIEMVHKTEWGQVVLRCSISEGGYTVERRLNFAARLVTADKVPEFLRFLARAEAMLETSLEVDS